MAAIDQSTVNKVQPSTIYKRYVNEKQWMVIIYLIEEDGIKEISLVGKTIILL